MTNEDKSENVPNTVQDLLGRIDIATATRMGRSLGAMYVGFLKSVDESDLSLVEKQNARMTFMISAFMDKRIGEKMDE